MRIPEGYQTETAQSRRTDATESGSPRSDSAIQCGMGASDEVHWSPLADTLRAAAWAEEPGRPERLARLAAEYASGRLQTDTRALSRAMVEGMLAGA